MPYNIMCVGPSQRLFFLFSTLSYLEAWPCYSQYPHAKTPDCVTPVNSRDVEPEGTLQSKAEALTQGVCDVLCLVTPILHGVSGCVPHHITSLCSLEVRSWGAASWHCESTCQVHKEKAVFYACPMPKGCETSHCWSTKSQLYAFSWTSPRTRRWAVEMGNPGSL